MLLKTIAIKNIGRFQNYSASGDVTLKRYNLIFAENGRGKTTICAILRSLQTGDPSYVNGRATLGSSEVPEVIILTDAGPTAFLGGVWSATVPALAIFDSTFVSENVYSGDAVDLDHRRNLYRVIIGKDGVILAREVDRLDTDIRAKTSQIRDLRAAIQSSVPPGISVEGFLAIAADPDIDVKINAAQMELESVRQAVQLRTHTALSPITLPVMPNNFEALLAATVEGLAADAGQRVSMQIATHGIHARGENWLSEGLGYIRGDNCPFCSQSLRGSTLLEAYRTYFSEAYNTLKKQISELKTAVETRLADRPVGQVERTIDGNDAASEFWARYIRVSRPTLSFPGGVGDPLRILRDAAIRLLDRKTGAPLERIPLDQAYTDSVSAVEALSRAVTSYNEAVQVANADIALKKTAVGNADVSGAERTLRHLHATKTRYEPNVIAECQAFETALAEKNALEEQKETARSRLDEYTTEVIGRYESTINRLLADFQAGFRVTQTKHAYPGGVPSSSFQILINNTAVDVGDAETPLDRPSFRNTLSSGDKSTLALAFFLAELEHDRDKATRIVVFDDPFNSQDAFRKDHTVEKIRKCGECCSQVIVLSHDQLFLKRIWDRLASRTADRKSLQLARIGLQNTAISEWDIDKVTQHRFAADLKVLADYYNANEGDPRNVVSKIRPVLEAYCRNLYPSQFLEADMLPAIITKIRHAGSAHPLTQVADDMDLINIYTRRYHHGEGPQPAMEIISETELQGFVRDALSITGYC